ncbi:DUF1801 domain-containing protein [Yoonia sp. R2331]|uniref:DUF1801 domain-containing protein n=1 Tax=Yoonia sp. R2331 TaxID=3237238 RepID=UPI0034E60E3B
MKPQTIEAYHAAQNAGDRAICDRLRALIDTGLPEAESKMWHAHPVWFLDGNPIVGYSKLKDCIRLMFWSGQSFEAQGLVKTGMFKAAEARFTDVGQIDAAALAAWLADSRRIQWDYKNIYKTKGVLNRLF